LAVFDDFRVVGLALSLLFRSVILPEILPATQLKFSIGIKLSSAPRIISLENAHFCPRFSAQVVPALHFDRSLLIVARDLASVAHVGPDPEIAMHCSAMVRECYDNSDANGERHIVCTSLVERGHAGTDGVTPTVVRVFELDTEDKCIKWLDK